MTNRTKLTALAAVALVAAMAMVLMPDAKAPPDSPEDPRRVSAVTEMTRAAGAPAARRAPDEAAPRFATQAVPTGSLMLEGLVVDAEDVPVADAWVSIDSVPPQRLQTGEDGTFAFENLVEGAYGLSVFHDGAVAGPVRARLTDTSEPVVLRTRPASRAFVFVVDGQTLRPVPGAQVIVRGTMSMVNDTDPRGIAFFGAVTDGAHTLEISANGYAPARASLSVAGGPGSHVRQVVALHRGAGLAGQVVSETGDPVVAATVSLYARGDHAPLAQARTEADGTWSLSAAPAGEHYVRVQHEGFIEARSEVFALDGKTERGDVLVELSRGAVVAGRVVDAGGAVVAHARVRVRHDGAGIRRQVVTDADGEFDVAGLPHGRVALMATTVKAASDMQIVEIPAGARAHTGVQIELDNTESIEGAVVGAGGEEIDHAQVTAVLQAPAAPLAYDAELRGEIVALTDTGGRFRFDGLVPGTYELRARRPGGPEPRSATLAASGTTNAVVSLADGGRVKGRVVYKGGDPVELFQVSVGPKQPQTFASADGTFEILECPPGGQSVVIKGPTFPTATRELTVSAGQVADAGAIEVAGGRRVAGRVVDETGAPVSGALVSVGAYVVSDGSSIWQGRSEGAGRRNTTSAEDGSFEFVGLGADEQVLIAEHPVRGRAVDVQVPPGLQDLSVDLMVERTGAIEGRVTLNGNGRQAVVTAMAGGVRSLHKTVALSDGRYRFTRLAPGTYVVSAHFALSPDSTVSVRSEPVSTESGAASGIDLDAPLGESSVVVDARTQSDRDWVGQVLLIPGTVTATRAVQLEAAIAEVDDGVVHQGAARSGRPVRIVGVRPGPHTVCVTAIDADADNVVDAVRDDPSAVATHCRSVDVGPGENQVSIDVEPNSLRAGADAPPGGKG